MSKEELVGWLVVVALVLVTASWIVIGIQLWPIGWAFRLAYFGLGSLALASFIAWMTS